MPTTGPLKPRRTGRVVRPKEEWIAIEAAAIVDPETWELAQQQLRLNRECSPRNTKTHAYLLQSLLICSYCQVRMLGHTTGRPEKPNRRYLCGRKASLKGHPTRCPARTFSADMLEERVWTSVSGLLQNPNLLLGQYYLRQEPGYGPLNNTSKIDSRGGKRRSAAKKSISSTRTRLAPWNCKLSRNDVAAFGTSVLG